MKRTEPTAVTSQQVHGAIRAMAATAQAIRDLGRVASGKLYATLMSVMDLPTYEKMIDLIVETGMVRRDGDELVWVAKEVL